MGNITKPTKYRNIISALESELRQMRTDGRHKLPTEEQLCQTFSCSRQTIRAALSTLKDKGLIVKRKGSGSYLADTVHTQSDKIVFVIEDEDEYIYPELISQLRQIFKRKKYSLICHSTNGSLQTEREILKKVIYDAPAAIIIEPICNIIPNPNLILIDEIADNGVPVIYLNTAYPSLCKSVCVFEDNTGGAALLIRYLAEKGYTKIAGIFRIDDSRGLERYRGCIQACLELDLPFDEKNYYLFSEAERRQLLRGDQSFLHRFINERLKDNTAVICHNDEIAFRLIRMFTQQGISVPKDVAVVSFDNSYYASSGTIGITSLGHTKVAASTAIADTFAAVISHREVRIKPIPWQLYIRGSG